MGSNLLVAGFFLIQMGYSGPCDDLSWDQNRANSVAADDMEKGRGRVGPQEQSKFGVPIVGNPNSGSKVACTRWHMFVLRPSEYD